MEDIKVSVICNTYNHEDYIRDALNSFVMQKTNFKFEVLVHDDASTDNTPTIIKEFEERYPDIIKPIYQTENQYSKKIPITKTYGYSRAKGKYIAFCEGDDYWTDEYKLQKQFDVLEAHPEVDMCAHTASFVRADNPDKVVMEIKPSQYNRVLSADEVILGGGGYLATNSLFYRKCLVENELPFRELLKLDYTLQISGSLRGGIYFLVDNMSVYRYMVKGSWTARHSTNVEKLNAVFLRIINMLKQLDIDTDHKYSDSIDNAIRESQFFIHKNNTNNKELLKKENRMFFKKLSFKNQIKIRLKAYFPFLLTVKEKLGKNS